MTETTSGAASCWMSIAAIVVVALCVHLPIIDEPWGVDHASWNGAWYLGRFIRAWDCVGFGETCGRPGLGVLPTKPPVIRAYTNHPPFYYWAAYTATKLCGKDERGFRCLPLAFHIGAALLLFLLLRNAMSQAAALGAALTLVVLPGGIEFGRMPNPESSVLCLCLLTYLMYQRCRGSSRAFLCAVGLPFGIACAFDWQAWFLIPALAVSDLMQADRGAKRRTVPRLALLALPGILAVAGFVCLVARWENATIPEALLHVVAKGKGTMAPRSDHGSLEWLVRQGAALRQLFGFVAISGALLGCLTLWKRDAESSRLRGLIGPLSVFGLLNIIVFRRHAFDHQFYWYHTSAAIASLFAAGVVHLSRRLGIRPGLVLLVAIGGVAGESLFLHDVAAPAASRELIVRVNSAMGSSDLLLRADEFGPEVFYIDAMSWDRLDDRDELLRIHDGWTRGWVRAEKVVYLLPDWVAERKPELREALPRIGTVHRFGGLTAVAFLRR